MSRAGRPVVPCGVGVVWCGGSHGCLMPLCGEAGGAAARPCSCIGIQLGFTCVCRVCLVYVEPQFWNPIGFLRVRVCMYVCVYACVSFVFGECGFVCCVVAQVTMAHMYLAVRWCMTGSHAHVVHDWLGHTYGST